MNATTTPVHADVTFDRLENAMRDGDAGFCIACGAETDGVEPDASEYRCDECGEPKVYGAEELLLRNLLHDEPATAGWTPRPAAGRSAAGAVRFPPATDTYHAGQADELLQDIARLGR